MRNSECEMRNIGSHCSGKTIRHVEPCRNIPLIIRNSECGMRNSECGMRNAECGTPRWGSPENHRFFGVLRRMRNKGQPQAQEIVFTCRLSHPILSSFMKRKWAPEQIAIAFESNRAANEPMNASQGANETNVSERSKREVDRCRNRMLSEHFGDGAT